VLIDPDNMSMRHNLACDLVIGQGDFDSIRDDERFKTMIAAAERRLATSNG
jgi:hypothetical protein